MRKLKWTKAKVRKVLRQVVAIINDSHTRGEPYPESFREVITFFRGPDAPSSGKIKGETTSKFRSRVGLKEGSSLDVNPIGRLVGVGELKLDDWEYHHREHYIRALSGLKKLGLLKPNDYRG